MNKEQFKKSLVDLVNYYIGNMMQCNAIAQSAQNGEKEELMKMVDSQVLALNHGFDQGIDMLTDKVFMQWESEDESPVSREK